MFTGFHSSTDPSVLLSLNLAIIVPSKRVLAVEPFVNHPAADAGAEKGDLYVSFRFHDMVCLDCRELAGKLEKFNKNNPFSVLSCLF